MIRLKLLPGRKNPFLKCNLWENAIISGKSSFFGRGAARDNCSSVVLFLKKRVLKVGGGTVIRETAVGGGGKRRKRGIIELWRGETGGSRRLHLQLARLLGG